MKRGTKILLWADGFATLALGMLGPIYALFVEQIGGDILDAGWAFFAFMITSGIVMFLISKWEDRFKHKSKLVVVGYGVLSSIISLLLFLLKLDGESASIMLMSVISIIGVVHMLVTSTIGVNMYHSISRWKAFFGIILIPLVILIIIIAFVGLALISPLLA